MAILNSKQEIRPHSHIFADFLVPLKGHQRVLELQIHANFLQKPFGYESIYLHRNGPLLENGLDRPEKPEISSEDFLDLWVVVVDISDFPAETQVFLNPWFAKPMVWVRVAFHENDGNHENDENDEDNADSYKQGIECWSRGNHGNHENDENHENPDFPKPRVPQTTGLEIPEKPLPLEPQEPKREPELYRSKQDRLHALAGPPLQAR